MLSDLLSFSKVKVLDDVFIPSCATRPSNAYVEMKGLHKSNLGHIVAKA
jgi:hypothetical protein